MKKVIDISNSITQCWNVFYYSFNTKQIVIYNVFNHKFFYTGVCKILKEFESIEKKTHEFDISAFSEAIRKEAMYYFWSKCEYEVIISAWPPNIQCESKKIDIYDQLQLNWDKFINYILINKKLFKKPKTKDVIQNT